jgi:hypothetical protein
MLIVAKEGARLCFFFFMNHLWKKLPLLRRLLNTYSLYKARPFCKKEIILCILYGALFLMLQVFGRSALNGVFLDEQPVVFGVAGAGLKGGGREGCSGSVFGVRSRSLSS